MRYNWQQHDWGKFTFDSSGVQSHLLLYAEKTAHLTGMLRALPEHLRSEAIVTLMTAEALKTSEIEGEFIQRKDLMSSIRNNLGLNPVPESVHDLRAVGLGQMMAEVRKSFAAPLSQQDLFQWHQHLLSYRQDLQTLGQWRQHTEPMQIVSGPLGRQRVHFEAPPSQAVPGMMQEYVDWFNRPLTTQESSNRNAPVRAAVAHIYFESIHPFEDGNGRIGRAIAEKALSQGLETPVPFSLSSAIESDKKAYYAALERGQQSNDLTPWLEYFVPTVLTAVEQAEHSIVFIIRKARFFDRFRDRLNKRQSKAILRMFAEGPAGFAGGMNARKYVGITGVSKATATRDLQFLLEIGALSSLGSGRSTRYELNLDDEGVLYL